MTLGVMLISGCSRLVCLAVKVESYFWLSEICLDHSLLIHGQISQSQATAQFTNVYGICTPLTNSLLLDTQLLALSCCL